MGEKGQWEIRMCKRYRQRATKVNQGKLKKKSATPVVTFN